MSTTTDNLPEYAVTIVECGDPQPVIDELTEWLDEQTAPEILTWVLVRSESGQPHDDEGAASAEGDETSETEDGPEPAEGDPAEPEFTEPAEDETDEGAEDD